MHGSKGKNGGRDITLANWKPEETGIDGDGFAGRGTEYIGFCFKGTQA